MACSIRTRVGVHVCRHRDRADRRDAAGRVDRIWIAEHHDIFSRQDLARRSGRSELPSDDLRACRVVDCFVNPIRVEVLNADDSTACAAVRDEMPERATGEIEMHLRQLNQITPGRRCGRSHQHRRQASRVKRLPVVARSARLLPNVPVGRTNVLRDRRDAGIHPTGIGFQRVFVGLDRVGVVSVLVQNTRKRKLLAGIRHRHLRAASQDLVEHTHKKTCAPRSVVSSVAAQTKASAESGEPSSA